MGMGNLAPRAPSVWLAVGVVLVGLNLSSAFADQVVLKNGDKLTGIVGPIADGKMKFTSPVLGEITIDMANVETFKTDAPATIRMKGEQPTTDKVESGTATDYKTTGGRDVPAGEVKVFNPPPSQWTGSILFSGALVRGNTETFDIGLDTTAQLRRERPPEIDDRFTVGAQYHFGTTGTGNASNTTTDNWNIFGKYDNFWTQKLYGYATAKLEHDRIAALYYRLTPGVGLGYQWFESPDFNFNTEAGVSYVHEDFDNDGTNDEIAGRLAYHVDKALNDKVKVFHNLEWLPAFEDPGDYLLTTDAGIHADLTKHFFSEFKVEWKRDSTPAPGALKNDTRFLLGVGWNF